MVIHRRLGVRARISGKDIRDGETEPRKHVVAVEGIDGVQDSNLVLVTVDMHETLFRQDHSDEPNACLQID